MEVIEAYKCSYCSEIHRSRNNALCCEFEHTRLNYANCLLEEGFEIGYINRVCGFGWNLTPEQDIVTKDNCFIMSYLQCCDKPAYSVTRIVDKNRIHLWGRGSWSGYYGTEINPSKLGKSYPKEDLFIDPRN